MADDRPPAAPCVLVVDDAPEVSALICEILEAEGYRTRALKSGTAALQPQDREGHRADDPAVGAAAGG